MEFEHRELTGRYKPRASAKQAYRKVVVHRVLGFIWGAPEADGFGQCASMQQRGGRHMVPLRIAITGKHARDTSDATLWGAVKQGNAHNHISVTFVKCS